MKKKCVICFSGGLDSTVLFSLMREEGYEVYALSVNYGQRHARGELQAADKILLTLKVEEYRVLDLRSLRHIMLGSSQTDASIEVPEGHYAEESMKATVVPNRNMILLALATAWAISLKAERVAYAAHAGDHTIYPDCRPRFVAKMDEAIKHCDWSPPVLYTPFVRSTKADIVCLGNDLGSPLELTYSCYKGREKHCGKCGTCNERKEAFKLAGVLDPTEYEM